MKKRYALLVLPFLLAGCSTPTPEPEPDVTIVDTEGTNVVVKFKADDSVNVGMEARQDTLTVLEKVHKDYPGKSITVDIVADFRDVNGNVSEQSGVLLNYSAESLDLINYKDEDHLVVAQRIWDAADLAPKRIHKDFE